VEVIRTGILKSLGEMKEFFRIINNFTYSGTFVTTTNITHECISFSLHDDDVFITNNIGLGSGAYLMFKCVRRTEALQASLGVQDNFVRVVYIRMPSFAFQFPVRFICVVAYNFALFKTIICGRISFCFMCVFR
jgi:hypothetical protein